MISAGTRRDPTVAVAPSRMPVLGHLLPLWRRPLPFLLSLRSSGPVVRVDLATLPVYFLTTPELVHQVLVSRASSFGRGRPFEQIRPLVGQSLSVIDGPFHQRRRRLMQPAFHPVRMATYAPVIERCARTLAGSWRPGDVVALDTALHRLALTALAEAVLSSDFGTAVAEEFVLSTPMLARGAVLEALLPRSFERLPTPWNRRFTAAMTRMHRLTEDAIRRHRAEEGGRADLLATLLAARDSDTGEEMSIKEVRDEVIEMLFAGSETVGTTLSWAFYELARHPKEESRLHAEVDAVAGGRSLTWDDVPRLEHTGRVIRETLRLHSIMVNMRRCTASVELGGARLPAGADVAFSSYAMHRDPELFTDPERFDPDRWLPERAARLAHHAYLPFGNGAHRCIGESFSMTEMVIVLATIAARWQLRPASGHVVREVFAGIPRPDALPMVVMSVAAPV